MKLKPLLTVIALIAVGPCISIAEEQIRDQTGVVIEIRQESGDTTYAYDGNRNFNFLAIGISGGVVDYRDKHGVHTGVGGAGTYQWAVQPPAQFGTSGSLHSR